MKTRAQKTKIQLTNDKVDHYDWVQRRESKYYAKAKAKVRVRVRVRVRVSVRVRSWAIW